VAVFLETHLLMVHPSLAVLYSVLRLGFVARTVQYLVFRTALSVFRRDLTLTHDFDAWVREQAPFTITFTSPH